MAEANAQRDVIAAQTELAQRQAQLRQQQLVAEVVKPAEADAEKVRVLAQADAERMQIQAEAARVTRPRGARPDADRPAATDRQGSRERFCQRKYH